VANLIRLVCGTTQARVRIVDSPRGGPDDVTLADAARWGGSCGPGSPPKTNSALE
jgi:hypothetical protein